MALVSPLTPAIFFVSFCCPLAIMNYIVIRSVLYANPFATRNFFLDTKLTPRWFVFPGAPPFFFSPAFSRSEAFSCGDLGRHPNGWLSYRSAPVLGMAA